MGWKHTFKNALALRSYAVLLLLLSFAQGAVSQTYTDGPIQLEVRLKHMKVFFDASDQSAFGFGFDPDELRFHVWATDNVGVSGLGWQGGTLLRWDGNPTAAGSITMPDYNYLMFSFIYPTNSVPQFFRLKMDGWEDDSPESLLGVGCGGNDDVYESSYCCGTIPIFGGCIVSEGDDYLCDVPLFKDNIDYRLGSPCEWYDHGYVNMIPGACSNDVYKPRVESFWRYTKGTGCANPIPLGPFAAGSSILHYNSNICYSNNYVPSPGNDVFYSFTIASPIGINASLCGPNGAQFNSVLYLLDANCNQLNMNDDGCGSQSTISTYLCQPGTYILVVDATAASEQGTFTLTLAEDPNFTYTANITKTDVDCFGAANGKARVTVNGGIPYPTGVPYRYAWSTPPGGTLDSITGLAPGSYTVTVTDSRGCSITATTTITQPTQLSATAVSTPVTCSGYTDGTATVTPTGGTPPYRYFWNGAPIQVTQTATNLPAGTIAYTVADNNNCIFSGTVTIGTSTVISVVPGTSGNVTCFGAGDGFINITVNGGTPNYSYSWSNSLASQNLQNLGPGQYTVTVTDQSGCNATYTHNITEPPLLTVQVDNTADARCNGGSDGAITVFALGGVQPYTYRWSNSATTKDLLNVPAGAYTVSVTDANNCVATVSQSISEPTALALLFNTINPTCAAGSTGSIDLTVAGGTIPYGYLWTNNATTEDITGIPEGTYGVLVTDANNCFKFEFRSLTDPTPVSVQVALVSHVTCNAGNDGAIQLSVTGGTGGYTYVWSPATVSGSNPTGLTAGFYNVTVSDQSGCSGTASTANVVVTQPTPLTAAVVNVDNVTCNGRSDGNVNISITGGVQPYTYNWSNNATTQNLSNVPGGTYGVTITDGNSCTVSLTSIVVNENPALTHTFTAVTPPSCFGVPNGTLTSTPAGGSGTYIYDWNTGEHTATISGLASGQYTVLVTDANGCNVFDTITIGAASAISFTGAVTDLICNGQANGQIELQNLTGGTAPYSFNWNTTPVKTTQIITGLSGGTYAVTVSDINNCLAVASYTVEEPDAFVLQMGSTDVKCYGDQSGVAYLEVFTGGTPPFTYSWSNGQTTAYATGLDPLTYTLTVTDANNCTVSSSTTVNGPVALVATVDSFKNNQCFGDANGLAYVSATGGTVPYQFSVINNVSQANGNFTDLPAGSYTAVVVDANNCRSTGSFAIAEPTDWSVKFKDPYVFVTRGAATPLKPLLVDTVPGVFTFSWSPSDGLDCTTCKNPKVSPVETTTYTVTATDANGCTHTAEIVVVAKDEYEVFFPNAFSPNGDGNNDVWLPLDFGSTESINIKVFDRWGNMVFESNDITKGWDGSFSGSTLPSDVYAYYISGTLRNKKDFKKTGSISLMK